VVVGARSDLGPADSILHRVQLISGRLRYSVPAPAGSGPARFAAVALSGSHVFVLDAEGGRILELGDDAKTLRIRMALSVRAPASLVFAGNDVAYVAHAAGVVRVDLARRRSAPLASASNVDLGGLQWIGRHQDTLLAIQARPDRTLEAIRLRLDRRGRRVTAIEMLGPAGSRAAAVMGGVFYYIASLPDGGTAVRRVKL
jgi:hypothetical protein